MKSFKVTVVIAAIDQATAKVRAINAAMARLVSPITRISSALGNLGRAAGFPQLMRGFAGVGRAVLDLGGKLRALLGPLGALTAFGTGCALVRMFGDAAAKASELKDTATKVGVSVEKLGELRHAAKMMGSSPESMDAGLQKGAKSLAEAAAGKNKDLAALYGKLGIKMRDARGQVRSFADMMPELADAFEKNTNPAVRLRMAVALGGKEFAELIPMLAQGRRELWRWMDAAVASGRLTTQQAEAISAWDDAWKALVASWDGTKNAIVAAISPFITPLVEGLKKWIDANRELIAGKVANWARAIAQAINEIDFKATWQDVKSFLKGIDGFVQKFGGWKVALAGLGVVMAGPLLASIYGVIAAIVKLGVVMYANPILAIIGLIAAGALLIINNWKEIVGAFEWVWGRIEGFFEARWARLKNTPLFSIGKWIVDGIKSLIPEIERIFGWLDEKLSALNRWLGFDPAKPAYASVPAGYGAQVDAWRAAGVPRAVAAGDNQISGWRGYTPGAIPRAAAAAAAPQGPLTGAVAVDVTLKNAPPGTRVETESSGVARDASTRVEYSMRDSLNY